MRQPRLVRNARTLATMLVAVLVRPVAAGEGPAHAAVAAPSSVSVPAGVAGLTASVSHEADAETAERVDGWVRNAHRGWIPNRGQVAGRDGRVASDVLYAATAPGVRAYVTSRGISLYFFRMSEEDEPSTELFRSDEGERTMRWSRLDLVLKGASIRPERARAERPIAEQGERHYYQRHCPDGVLHVPAYGRVTFSEVYPGIDWVLTSEPGGPVEHDFVVRPGADPGRIRLEFKGAEAMELAEDARSLRVRTALGELREGPLRCYQEDSAAAVPARFRLSGKTVSVRVADYDRSAPLVIDPPLVWSTYYGGDGFDGPRTIYCDNPNDAIYVVGYTTSPNMPVLSMGGNAHYQGTYGGGAFTDGFIWKFNQQGVRLWATYYGGSNLDEIYDCVVDGTGNLYACGKTTSNNFPTLVMAGAYNQGAPTGGDWNAVVLKFNAQGIRQWATSYGGSGAEWATGITLDASGRVYVCGYTNSSNLVFANPGGGAWFDNTPNGTIDALVLRFGTLGNLEWATYLGGDSSDDAAFGIAIGGNQLYVTGSTLSTDFPTVNPGGAFFQSTNNGNEDTFISRFTIAGALTWSTYHGGSSNDYGDEPAVDANGNLFVNGYTYSSDMQTFDPGGGAFYDNTLGGTRDLFLLAFNAAGAQTWGTYLGGSADDFLFERFGKSILVDPQGRVYVTGITDSNDFPVMMDGNAFYQGAIAGGPDAFITRFSGAGVMQWSTYMGSMGATDFGRSMAFSVNGCLFMAGESWVNGSFPTMNPGLNAWFDTTNQDLDDSILTKFCVATAACCHDFNCSHVSSAAECFATGGTAFHPGQPCANVVCTTQCTICGRKFSDLDRDGFQDGGEPGLGGWTIELRYPNGVLYTTTVTGANGDYCFPNIPCGQWVVTEVQQPGWVKVHPTTAGHTVTLNTGNTLNGVHFGNYSCPTPAPCYANPPGLAASWPFDDGIGSTTAADVTHARPFRNVAVLEGGATSGGGTLCLTGAADYARVPASGQLGLDAGTGSFAVVTWVHPSPSSASPRTIAERREGSAMGVRGWALYLDGLQSMLQIGTGGTPVTITGPILSGGTWTHLAVSVDRSGYHGRWYVNGAAVTAYDFVPPAGSVSSAADFMIGQMNPAIGVGPSFNGCLGSLAVLSTPLSSDVAAKAYVPGPGPGYDANWCPEGAYLPLVTTVCPTQNTATMCFTVYNATAAPATYSWSLAGLPAGPGCTSAGPTQFSPSSGTVVVPAGGVSAPICVTITRPVGLTGNGSTGCYSLTLVNRATGVCRTRTAKLRVDNSCWCVTPIPTGVVSVPLGSAGKMLGFGLQRACDPVASLGYRVSAVWPDPDHGDPLAVSLNGLAPGTPVTGVVSAGPGADGEVQVTVTYPNGYDPAARYEIVLEADTDGDGSMERLASAFVEPDYAAGTLDAPPAPPVPAGGSRLTASPNPFFHSASLEFTLARDEDVDLGIYDLGGRLVRQLVRARLAAGRHRYDWDGRDDRGRAAPAGVYLARRTGDRQGMKLVKMR